MDFFRAAAISGSGMLAQKLRIETAAANIANMSSTAGTGGQVYQPLTVVMHADNAQFAAAWESTETAPASVVASVTAQANAKARVVHEPGHPDADSQGMVTYPGVDHVHEMMTVTSALRAYEANLAALQASKTLALKALEIGGQ